MVLESSLNICLVSQQIRDLINKGRLIPSLFDELRVQPSSYEPIIGDEVFILDTEVTGLFRPNKGESVYRTLLQLPNRQRRRVNITGGFESKKSFTYLTRLEDKVKLDNGMYIKSSPKSSSGRLFLNTRLLMDYNPCFDEGSNHYLPNQELDLWLLIQSLAFNVIIYPRLTLNQLRFFRGNGGLLAPSELREELRENPLIYSKDKEGLLTPIEPIITDGLQIHLNFSGKYTEGIVGLRARHNSPSIDLSKEKEYEAEDFFEPVKGKKITIKREEHYLLSSNEILGIPPHLNVELRSHSHIGFSGPLHFAGFVDNGFQGDLVFEVRSDEISDIELEDGMPISKLDVFRIEVPDKLYGEKIGSHYQGQIGPRTSKHFKPFDFSHAAKNYKKLDRLVLVQIAEILNNHRENKEGFEFMSPDKINDLYRDIENGFFHSRYDCEKDELILQPIPYVILFGPNETIFSYVRAENIRDYGEIRLSKKYSIGLGGHIIKADSPDYVKRCLEREVTQEEVKIQGNYSEPKLMGTLMAYDEPVDRVHFGLIFKSHVDGNVKPKESSIISGGMITLKQLIEGDLSNYETWSKVLIPYIYRIYQL